MAPEVVRREPYGCAADVWSAGVVLYIMLGGLPPFYGEKDEIEQRTLAGEYGFPSPEFDDVHKGAKVGCVEAARNAQALIVRALARDPARRITVPDMLAHPWIEVVPPPRQPRSQRRAPGSMQHGTTVRAS
jgi:serine/threonine protein kinase